MFMNPTLKTLNERLLSGIIGLEYRAGLVQFDHLQHHVTEFLMRKFAVNSPSPALVKVDSPNIGLDHSKADNVMATAAYFTFRVGLRGTLSVTFEEGTSVRYRREQLRVHQRLELLVVGFETHLNLLTVGIDSRVLDCNFLRRS